MGYNTCATPSTYKPDFFLYDKAPTSVHGLLKLNSLGSCLDTRYYRNGFLSICVIVKKFTKRKFQCQEKFVTDGARHFSDRAPVRRVVSVSGNKILAERLAERRVAWSCTRDTMHCATGFLLLNIRIFFCYFKDKQKNVKLIILLHEFMYIYAALFLCLHKFNFRFLGSVNLILTFRFLFWNLS